MQGTHTEPLIQEDPKCRGATKPMGHKYRACALDSESDNKLATKLRRFQTSSRRKLIQQQRPSVFCKKKKKKTPTQM